MKKQRLRKKLNRSTGLIFILWICFIAVPGKANPDNSIATHALQLLSNELVDEARPLVQAYTASNPDPVTAHILKAHLLFLENQFEDALMSIQEARALSDVIPEKSDLENLIEATLDTTRGMSTYTTSGGHFVIHYLPGVDQVLLPYADQALESAYKVYGQVLDYRPTQPVHVHIYPKIENLAAVSSLKVSEIQNSGTIALCKYNRLMITSPRDLLFGYPWLDTLAHEYIHYVLIKRSSNTIPIWLHEGLAKFFENRWREDADAILRPTSQDILAAGLAAHHLVSFEEMSPSMAKLPTQQETALAFAEVFTVIEYVKKQVGLGGIIQLIDAMRSGKSDRDAIASVLGVSFASFERTWKKYLKGLSLTQLPGSYTQKLYFKNKDTNEDELESIEEKEAKDFTYLGDLLRARERNLAASKEYEKAAALSERSSPIIQAKLAVTHLSLGAPKAALNAIVKPLKFYPEYVLLYLHGGRAYLKQGDFEQAVRFLERAVSLNPFDIETHQHLATAYEALGKTEELNREKRAIEILMENR